MGREQNIIGRIPGPTMMLVLCGFTYAWYHTRARVVVIPRAFVETRNKETHLRVSIVVGAVRSF